tara:strand:+ start:409 stop:651 length:243 start_codon:yes stop_codon:yes gene_type:complete
MDGTGHISVSLTLEDEFTLTRIKNGAKKLRGKERDQYFWDRIVRFVCRERAYKFVVDELGVVVDPNIEVFDDLEKDGDIS